MIADEVDMIEGTDEGDSEIFEFLIDSLLKISEGDVKLDVVNFEEVNDFKGVSDLLS